MEVNNLLDIYQMNFLGNIIRSLLGGFLTAMMYFIESAAVSTEEIGNPIYPPLCRK